MHDTWTSPELDSLLGDERALLEVQQRFFVHARRLREHGVQAALRRLLFEHEVPARVLAQPDGERLCAGRAARGRTDDHHRERWPDRG